MHGLSDTVTHEFLDNIQSLAFNEALHQARDFQPGITAGHRSDGQVEGFRRAIQELLNFRTYFPDGECNGGITAPTVDSAPSVD